MKKNTLFLTIFVAILLVGGALGVYFGFSQQSVASTQYYETAFYSSIKCEVCGATVTTQGDGVNGKQVYSTESAGDTPSWDLEVRVNPPGTLERPIRLGVSVNGVWTYAYADMTNPSTLTITKTGLRPTDIVKLSLNKKRCEALGLGNCYYDEPYDDPSFIYYVKATPYCLFRYNMLGGGITKVNSRDCEVSQSIYDNQILSENVGKASDSGTNSQLNPQASGTTIHPYQHIAIGTPYNYVSDFITVPALTLEEYNGQKVKCIANGVDRSYYAFSTITTPDGTYNVLDFSKEVGNPVCCERESTPEKTCQDGKWIAHEEASCSLTKPCAGSSWNPNSANDKQLVRYKCSSGQCVPEYKDVQCTSNLQCGANQICDASWNCIDAGTGEEPDLPIENATTCEDKLGGLVPSQYVTTEKCTSLWCDIGLSPKTETGKCVHDWSFVWIISFAIIMAVVLIVLIKQRYPQKKSRK